MTPDDHTFTALITYRSYLTTRLVLAGAHWTLAAEAVSSTAIEHPEWDMDEARTWSDWEAHSDRGDAS